MVNDYFNIYYIVNEKINLYYLINLSIIYQDQENVYILITINKKFFFCIILKYLHINFRIIFVYTN